MKILDRFSGSLKFEFEAPTIKLVVEAAIKSRANLSRADLYGADLYGANLSRADLSGANLYGANLYGANLYGADLSGANLYGANLSRANFSGANLSGANLKDTTHLSQQCITPEGVLIGYKKLQGGDIVTLRIPAKAKRVNAYGSRKCRAEYAVVVAGNGIAKHDSKTEYKKGKTVRPDKFDPDPRVECSNGIHFFITREEAESY
jgi:hypothetical protein